MTRSLADFQFDLGRALLGEDTCPIDPNSPGFRFTMTVRRSWCEGRALMSARPVAEIMPDEARQRLVSVYVDQGGGLALFLPTEGEAFLEFLTPRLPNPSHALTLCWMTQALNRARKAPAPFVPSEKLPATVAVRRGRYATLIWFHADPDAVMAAVRGAPLPPLGPPSNPVLFAPGIEGLFRPATESEAALWVALSDAHAPAEVAEVLLREGVLEYVC
jgi:hypothetical protein